ncbi:MAG TPA: low-specificity L-threonine aldolase [Bosea sp. (in: a-proteobacteria)]
MNSPDQRSAPISIDLRSDTVTRPSAGMLAAMASAEVGDDVWRDDPTVQRLEARVAEAAGKEAGLYFPSGTQSNLAALMSHCGRGDEYIVGQVAHTYKYEGGGAAVLGSIQPQPIENAADGSLPVEKIRSAIKPVDPHFARTKLITLENTIGGRALDPAYVEQVREIAREVGLAFHLDGARAWNAAIVTGQPLATICAPFDTVSLCFSKGLGAPVGSVLVGPRGFLEEARRWRKVLGGGMRQVGYLAAACEYALDHQVERLAEDHDNARHLAQGLTRLLGDAVHYTGTNMVFLQPNGSFSAPDLAGHLGGLGVGVVPDTKLRLVTHLNVSRADIDRVLEIVAGYFSNSR